MIGLVNLIIILLVIAIPILIVYNYKIKERYPFGETCIYCGRKTTNDYGDFYHFSDCEYVDLYSNLLDNKRK